MGDLFGYGCVLCVVMGCVFSVGCVCACSMGVVSGGVLAEDASYICLVFVCLVL